LEISRPATRGDVRAKPTAAERSQIQARQVDLLYDQSLWSLPGGLAAALLLAAILWPVTSTTALLVWTGALGSVTAFRLLLTVLYLRRPAGEQRAGAWRRAFTGGTAVSAAIWAAGAIFVSPAGSLPHWGAYLLWLGGLVAGGVATLSVVMTAYLAFALPALLPVATYLLLGPEAMARTVGGVLLLFLASMVVAAWRVNRAILTALRLQFENYQLNNQLRADLERHVHVETQLREAKRRAEALARELRQLSIEDGLTGISNRRHFDQVFLREWRRALRGRYPLTLVMLDLDFFKPFNDRYGHRAGDDCLREVAGVLREHCRRPGDQAARYGGEEFAVVLPGTGSMDAREIAQRIASDVEALAIPHDLSTVSRVVTVSGGVATLVPDRNMDFRHLIEMADAALYRAKGEGRNRITVAPDVLAEIALQS